MKKIYSYCSIGDENYGTIEGIVLSMKVRNYIKEDGTPGEMVTFGLSCRNVDEKIKSALGIYPTKSSVNPEISFVNCTVFGKKGERIRKFVHEKDLAVVSGKFSVYTSGKGNDSRVTLLVNEAKVLRYSKGDSSSENESKYSYCSIGDGNYGTIEGVVSPVNFKSYTREDGTTSEMMVFNLSCRNVDEKIKAMLDVSPVVDEENREVSFINCAVFGKKCERIRKFINEKDLVLLSGKFSSFKHEGKDSGVSLIVDNARVLKYATDKFTENSY